MMDSFFEGFNKVAGMKRVLRLNDAVVKSVEGLKFKKKDLVDAAARAVNKLQRRRGIYHAKPKSVKDVYQQSLKDIYRLRPKP